jgi:hypothetical protein
MAQGSRRIMSESIVIYMKEKVYANYGSDVGYTNASK